MFDQMPGFIWLYGELLHWQDTKCHVMACHKIKYNLLLKANQATLCELRYLNSSV